MFVTHVSTRRAARSGLKALLGMCLQGTSMILRASTSFKTTIGLVFLALLGACGGDDKEARPGPSTIQAPSPTISAHAPQGAQAHFIGRDGTQIGAAALLPGANGGVVVDIVLSGLAPGWHGVHFHNKGDCSDFGAGFKAAGGHFNPGGRHHGFFNPAGYEPANLPNIYVHADGIGAVQFFNANVRLSASSPSDLPALLSESGIALVVHENPDDHYSAPIGGAGGRVACAAFSAAD